MGFAQEKIEGPPSAPKTLGVSSREPLLASKPLLLVLGGIVLVAISRAMLTVHEVLVFAFFAVLLSVLMSFPVDLLSKRGLLPRGLAVLLSLALMAGTCVGVVELTVPIVTQQVDQLSSQLPAAIARAEKIVSGTAKKPGPLQEIAPAPKIVANLRDRLAQKIGELATMTIPAALGVVSGLSTMILVVVLAAFFAYRPDHYKQGIRLLVPRPHEAHFEQAWGRVGLGLRHWIGGIVVAMLLMGAFTAAGLWVAGVEGWFTLGLFTLFGTFIPYAGAIASAIPGLLIALADSPQRFIYALIVYLLVHIVEGYIVEPYVMRRAVTLQPGWLLLWQALMAALLGVLGIVIATPLLVCIKAAGGYFWVERYLGKEPPAV